MDESGEMADAAIQFEMGALSIPLPGDIWKKCLCVHLRNRWDKHRSDDVNFGHIEPCERRVARPTSQIRKTL